MFTVYVKVVLMVAVDILNYVPDSRAAPSELRIYAGIFGRRADQDDLLVPTIQVV